MEMVIYEDETTSFRFDPDQQDTIIIKQGKDRVTVNHDQMERFSIALKFASPDPK